MPGFLGDHGQEVVAARIRDQENLTAGAVSRPTNFDTDRPSNFPSCRSATLVDHPPCRSVIPLSVEVPPPSAGLLHSPAVAVRAVTREAPMPCILVFPVCVPRPRWFHQSVWKARAFSRVSFIASFGVSRAVARMPPNRMQLSRAVPVTGGNACTERAGASHGISGVGVGGVGTSGRWRGVDHGGGRSAPPLTAPTAPRFPGAYPFMVGEALPE